MAVQRRAMTTRVTLKPMKRRHLQQVLAIEEHVYTSGWSRSIFLNELLYARDRIYLVATVGRMVVGYAGVWFTPDEGHVTTIAVHPDWQRHRIASRLLGRLLTLARDRERDAMTLEVRVSNSAAQAMYEKFGFAAEGTRPRYYADNQEDAVIMWVRGIGSDAYRQRLDSLAVTGTSIRGGA